MISRRSDSSRPPEHRLAFLDQTALELLRTTGRNQLIQSVWIYEHPVDLERLKRFHHNLYASLASRLIERSPLPFGRPRWVRSADEPPPIQHGAGSRPRSELMAWADELGTLPIDPERGPACYVAVQPLDDGATAVSVVASHVISDGVGGMLAIFEAVTGHIRNPGYDTWRSRPRSRAIVEDLRQAARDLPLTIRTAVGAVKLVRENKGAVLAGRATSDPKPDDRHVVLPSVVLYIDIAEWDARAESLGGNSYSLLAGFAAKLAQRMGRTRKSDGMVSLSIAINLRESLDDDRALAMAFANVAVDPATVTTDLAQARAAIRRARELAKGETDPAMELMALIPWAPRRGARLITELLFGYSNDLPVSCSNLGDLPSELACIDGTPAEYVFIRALDTSVTLGELRRSHGQLVVVSGRINGKVSISVEAYQLDAENSHARLRRIVRSALAEFGLTAVIG